MCFGSLYIDFGRNTGSVPEPKGNWPNIGTLSRCNIRREWLRRLSAKRR